MISARTPALLLVPLWVGLLLSLLLGCQPSSLDNSTQHRDPWRPDASQVIANAPEIRRQPPDNVAEALLLARHHLSEAGRGVDASHYDRAEGLLRHWWPDSNSDEVDILMAHLLQRRHQFDSALQALEPVLQRNPRSAQAWLTRAMILRAQGRLQDSLQACQMLRRLTDTLVHQACVLASRSLTRPGARTSELLHYLIANRPIDDATTMQWARRVAAEAAWVRGDQVSALEYLQQSNARSPADTVSLTMHLDLLLQLGELDAARRLLDSLPQALDNASLLLRRAMVDKRANGTTWRSDRERLVREQRILEQRGEGNLHLREQAMLALHVDRDYARGLELALDNWSTQREWQDAMLLLGSALETGRADAASPVLQWLQDEAVRHPQLLKMAQQLEQP